MRSPRVLAGLLFLLGLFTCLCAILIRHLGYRPLPAYLESAPKLVTEKFIESAGAFAGSVAFGLPLALLVLVFLRLAKRIGPLRPHLPLAVSMSALVVSLAFAGVQYLNVSTMAHFGTQWPADNQWALGEALDGRLPVMIGEAERMKDDTVSFVLRIDFGEGTMRWGRIHYRGECVPKTARAVSGVRIYSPYGTFITEDRIGKPTVSGAAPSAALVKNVELACRSAMSP